MISVWVVDDHSIIRQGIKRILIEESTEFLVTQEASSVAHLFSLFESQILPQILILDLSMPGRSGLEALSEIKQKFPRLPILILSVHPEDQYAVRTLKAGASGYLSKGCAPEQLIQALKAIIKGEKYITIRVANVLAENIRSPQSSHPHQLLSDREYQILILVAQGKSLTEIANNIFLSVKTVSTYKNRILKKMNMKTNTEIFQYVSDFKLLQKNSTNLL